MAVSVVMPALEMAQEEGKLVAWRKQEGEHVTKGEPLMEVETDKAVVEVEAEADGLLAGVTVQPGDVVPVGRTIAWIVAPGEEPPATDAAAPSSRAPVAVAVEAPVSEASASPVPGARVPMSPRARRLAAEAAARVEAAAPAASPATASGAAPQEAVGSVWRVMSERMTAAWTSVPHFFLTRELDAGALVAWREQAGPESTITDVLVAALAKTLRQHPRMNASWVDHTPRFNDEVNIGIATAADQAVVVPVIKSADRLSLSEIGARRRELVERARAGRLRPADLSDGTFTVSNLGMYGVDSFLAIVNPPQAGILAIGRVAERVVAREGQPVVRPVFVATLSCDHRVVDGARAAEFFRDLAEAIEHPQEFRS